MQRDKESNTSADSLPQKPIANTVAGLLRVQKASFVVSLDDFLFCKNQQTWLPA